MMTGATPISGNLHMLHDKILLTTVATRVNKMLLMYVTKSMFLSCFAASCSFHYNSFHKSGGWGCHTYHTIRQSSLALANTPFRSYFTPISLYRVVATHLCSIQPIMYWFYSHFSWWIPQISVVKSCSIKMFPSPWRVLCWKNTSL
jgi:hypothetical protein